MAEDTKVAPRLGWSPIEGRFATPIYFEGEELVGGTGAPPPEVASPAPEAPSPEPPPGEAAPTADAPSDGAPPPPPWEGKTPEELWRRNEELIKENAAKKERYRPWEEVTEGLDPADVDFYRDFLGAVKSRDEAKLAELAPLMRQALDHLSPAQQQQVADAIEAAEEEFDPFDRAQVEKLAEQKALALIEQREQQREHDRQVQQALTDMNNRLAELAKPDADGGVGIPELADTTSPEYATVLWMAKNDPEVASIGDPMERLGKAAQKYRDRLDERAQALLKAKSAEASAPASPQSGSTPGGPKVPKDMAAARQSAAARLDKLILGSEQSVGT